MSLVSYGASDESDTSDDDTVTTNVQTTPKVDEAKKVLSGHISDEDFDASVGSSSVTSTWTSDVQSVKGFDNGLLRNLKPDDAVNSTSVTTLEDLPAPQSRIYAIETEETDLEDEVKPKASEIANAPKPPSKKQKQPVKITIPSLDDEPDNEDKEFKKKADPSKVKSGLFSLLPAPVHTSKKETNRPLIPYTLTKKPSSGAASAISSTGCKQSTSTQPKSSTITKVKSTTEAASTSDIFSKRMSTFNALTGYDSDSEDDDDGAQGSTTNFFSLSSTSEVTAGSSPSEITTKRLQSEEVSSSKSDIAPTVVNQSKQEENVASSEKNDEVENVMEEKVCGPEPGAVNDAPLDFRSVNRLSAWSASSYGFLGPVGLSGPVQEQKSYSLSVSSSSLPSSSDYNMANSEVSSEMDDEGIETLADDDLKKFMGEKEFQKLQGKRKRFEEAVDFVDANVDDFVDPSEVTKHLTEETEYVSQRNKDNLPTAQQRRKKQITYLAYQAKERELELKNTWAQNRMTKKQTQSKYGF